MQWKFGTASTADMKVVRKVQRAQIDSWVRKLAKGFDPEGIGVITVSRRGDGHLVLIDGQHRILAMRELGIANMKVPCKIYSGLKESEEARLFRLLNNTRRISAYDLFDKGVVSGDTECVAIAEIVESHGLKIAGDAADGKVCCVSALQSIHMRNGKVRPGLLSKTIAVAIRAWGRVAGAVSSPILQGIALILLRNGEDLDMDALVVRLSKYSGGPTALYGRAKALKEIQKGSLVELVAAVITQVYNKGRRASALPRL